MKFFILTFVFCAQVFSATGTQYDVMNVQTLDKSKLNFAGLKTSATVPAQTTQDIDLVLTDDMLFTGAQLMLSGNCDLDEIQLKIVMGTTVVNTFIDWYAVNLCKELLYPAKIPAGLKIRATYKNTCPSGAVTVRLNYSLHKVLQ